MVQVVGARVLTCGAVLLGVVLGVSACTPDPAPTPTPSSAVVQPGRPGEGATTVAPEDYTAAPEEDSWNEADAAFVTGMIEHHLQALEIAALAPDRAGSDAVRSFAERVTAAQGPEVHGLAAWLQARDLAVPEGAQGAGGTGPRTPEGAGSEHGAHGDGVAGMLSDEQLAALESANGAEFDRLFLEGMIQHHEGALAMTDVVLVEGQDLFANEIAAETASGQGGEIERMRDLLADL
ncbi:DUF305 domain-containing protein [Cellulosimicrobium protaetiae]|uniref:DUF305 domain-containing protein n=1 Tax=Cellulosimicrobium protaetiae TaxID=2587808 RepID=A0A6M5UCW4_9MICO|nr:DUF305 domain-containing protein [Cellulosimicrobium protaetiae]QJW35442.1 DUF305 domain-containing protein [Cellulosimicrobium protaetiae]